MKKIIFVLSVLLVFIVSSGTVFAAEKEYLIGKGDSLTIRVWGEPELSSAVIVRPDGKISLPNIGELKVIGITPRALRHRIASALTEYIFNPVVSVSVNSFPSNSVIVYGPGTNSATIPLNGKTSLLQLLSNIRPGVNADLENAYLERDGKKIAENFDKLYKEGDENLASIEILASDKLYIPKKPNLLVFIDGAVGRPTSIPFVEDMTVLEAIHKAGGFTKFADPNETVITRNSERIVVRLDDLINDGDMSQNVTLQGGDLIVVDTSWF